MEKKESLVSTKAWVCSPTLFNKTRHEVVKLAHQAAITPEASSWDTLAHNVVLVIMALVPDQALLPSFHFKR